MGQRVFLALRSLLYVTGFALVWLWLMPQWINLRTSTSFPSQTPSRRLGLIPLVLGAVLAFNCFARFLFAGKGTPAPFDAPRRLVISGPYRYVRNPMYVGVVALILGQALLLGNLRVLEYGLLVWLLFHLFVLLYEEPTLRRTYGVEYDRFLASVPRWIPLLRSRRPSEK